MTGKSKKKKLLSERLIEELYEYGEKYTPKERFDRMVKSGVIDVHGRVLI